MTNPNTSIPRTIMLLLTEDCNLRCTYCYEHHCPGHEMTVETALEIITREMNRPGSDTLILDFFGGEPFLKFDVIQQVCQYVWAHKWPKEYLFCASTNGTLIHGEIQDWLQSNKERFNLGLSFDGNETMQNVNRCNSFHRVDLDFFARNWPDQTVKMTISPESIRTLADGIIFLHNKGFKVSCNLAYGMDWTDKALETVLRKELEKLVAYYCDHPETEPCSMLNHDMVLVGQTDLSTDLHQYCGSGLYMTAYRYNGDAYPCQMFMPIAMGDRDWSSTVFRQTISPQLINEECRTCAARDFCASCAGFNFMATGSIHRRDTSTCALNKLTFTACAGLAYFKFQRGQLGTLYNSYDLDPKNKSNLNLGRFMNGITLWQALNQ